MWVYIKRVTHLLLAPVGQLLEDVTRQEAEILCGQEVCTRPDEATIGEGRERSPLRIGQAGACSSTAWQDIAQHSIA